MEILNWSWGVLQKPHFIKQKQGEPTKTN